MLQIIWRIVVPEKGVSSQQLQEEILGLKIDVVQGHA